MRVRGLKRKSLKTGEVLSESHPVRVRGLKHFQFIQQILFAIVAPRAGAWIETGLSGNDHGCRGSSHPVRVRGLKPDLPLRCPAGTVVAPRAGAWIETFNLIAINELLNVAPRAGAWIETSMSDLIPYKLTPVAPRAGAWIETPNA